MIWLGCIGYKFVICEIGWDGIWIFLYIICVNLLIECFLVLMREVNELIVYVE